jgi:hypothetical protein
MKPEKYNLKDEIINRIFLSKNHMESSKDDKMISLIFENENSQYLEFLELIKLFENRIGYQEFLTSNFTPILDFKTKEPLKIGDKVKNLNNQCGILKFDECFNKYVIKTETGGHITSSSYIKIQELFDYTIDTTKVECRPQPHKKRW